MRRKGHFTDGGEGQGELGLSPPSGPAASEAGIRTDRDNCRRVVPVLEEGDSASPSSFIPLGVPAHAVVMRLANKRIRIRVTGPGALGGEDRDQS